MDWTKQMVNKGDKGDAVIYVQKTLAILGYDPGTVDGIYGAKTIAAVQAFQKASGLNPDGIVGPLTGAKLEEQHAVKMKGGAVKAAPPKPGMAPAAAPAPDKAAAMKAGEQAKAVDAAKAVQAKQMADAKAAADKQAAVAKAAADKQAADAKAAEAEKQAKALEAARLAMGIQPPKK